VNRDQQKISRRHFSQMAGSSALIMAFGTPLTKALAGGLPDGVVRWPAEWELHDGCLICWPHSRWLWGPLLPKLQAEFAAVAQAINQFEQVTMIAHPGHGDEAANQCGAGVDVIEIPLDDSWVRDSGPIFVDRGGQRLGMDFGFNAWGEKYPNWEKDDYLPIPVCEYLGIPCHTVKPVLEGGAIIGDGEGTIITTEECLLNPNRNGYVSKAQVERGLRRALGAEKVVWLPWGLTPDDITDGHVDGVAAYVAPGRVLMQTYPSGGGFSDEIRIRLEENMAVLSNETDARGRSFDIIEFPVLTKAPFHGFNILFTYLNFYHANGAIIVPIANTSDDADALARLESVFPEQQIVPVVTPSINFGGGGIHCITQQIPVV